MCKSANVRVLEETCEEADSTSQSVWQTYVCLEGSCQAISGKQLFPAEASDRPTNVCERCGQDMAKTGMPVIWLATDHRWLCKHCREKEKH